jgi:hypothetical protein
MLGVKPNGISSFDGRFPEACKNPECNRPLPVAAGHGGHKAGETRIGRPRFPVDDGVDREVVAIVRIKLVDGAVEGLQALLRRTGIDRYRHGTRHGREQLLHGLAEPLLSVMEVIVDDALMVGSEPLTEDQASPFARETGFRCRSWRPAAASCTPGWSSWAIFAVVR